MTVTGRLLCPPSTVQQTGQHKVMGKAQWPGQLSAAVRETGFLTGSGTCIVQPPQEGADGFRPSVHRRENAGEIIPLESKSDKPVLVVVGP